MKQDSFPIVSFVVPVYNVSSYIEQCINSMLEQNDKNYEIILIDDESTDGSEDICNYYAEKSDKIITYRQKNQGVSVARNQGLLMAKGEWICFVDGDDWVEPELVSTVNRIKDNEFDIIFFAFNSIKNGEVENKINTELNGVVLDENDFLMLQMSILNQGDARVKKYHHIEGTPWAKVYRREFLQKHNLQFTPGVRKGQDGLFNMQTYEMAKCGLYNKEIVYNYRINESSVCRRYNANISQYSRRLIEEYKKQLKVSDNAQLKELFDYFVVRQFMYCILLDYCHRNNPQNYRIRREHYLNEKEKYQSYIHQLKLANMKTNEKGLLIIIRYLPFSILNLMIKMLKK